jgi:collagenase-like PrtC family protease
MIDSVAKLEAVLALVHASRFLPPGKIPLDRALNRCPGALREMVAVIRKRYPDVLVELLANEGCLNHCAFRATHESLIAAANAGIPIDTFCLNRDFGCVRILSEAPHRILASPFIRPEDLPHYTDVADIIKISGRTLGGAFLRRAVAAYTAGRYDGNLLDLLDAAHWMGQQWDLPNGKLPADLLERLTACDQTCTACTVCREIFDRHARALPMHLQTFDHM